VHEVPERRLPKVLPRGAHGGAACADRHSPRRPLGERRQRRRGGEGRARGRGGGRPEVVEGQRAAPPGLLQAMSVRRHPGGLQPRGELRVLPRARVQAQAEGAAEQDHPDAVQAAGRQAR